MDISKLKILVAEDNQLNSLLIKKLFAKWDLVPDFAVNGAEAVEAFKNKSYDLILMDIHMPIMDGYQATAMIRSDPDTEKAKVQIVALTASVGADVKTEIQEAGMDDFISKPFNHDELRVKLEHIASEKTNT
jgi:CheY-like chemotaxis protein